MRLVAAALGVALLLGGSACSERSVDSDEPGQRTRVVLEPSSKSTEEELDLSVEIIRERLDGLGVRDPSVKRQEETIEVIVPGTAEREVPIVIRRGLLGFYDLQGDLAKVSLDEQGFPRASRKRLEERPGTIVVTCGPAARYCPGVDAEPQATYYYVFEDGPELTGDDIDLDGTRQDFDPTVGEPVVLIRFTRAGAKKFEDVTLKLAERGRVLHNRNGGEPWIYLQQFAIVLDRELKSAPTIDFQDNPAGIPGDAGAQIAGIGSVREARNLALVLQSGALPLEFRVASKETRG
jgi:preprotein translocase subunit SecD